MGFQLPFAFVQAITQAFVDPCYVSHPVHAYEATESYTSTCGRTSQIPPITVTVTKSSLVSMEDAQNQARADATAKAIAMRVLNPCPV